MRIKSVVKVMNFHALLRVEKARKQADIISSMRLKLEQMLGSIINNRNLRLDKMLKLPDPHLPALRIYLGSDYGFCGSVNSSVSTALEKDKNCEKIVIGKKVRKNKEVSLSLTWDEYFADINLVRDYFMRAVRERSWSAVELVYNHYYNVGSIKLERRRIFPLTPEAMAGFQGDDGANADFIIESSITDLLEEMFVAYIFYEFRIAITSAYAAENTLRQSATQESIKKLEEQEVETLRVELKEKNEKSNRKTIDSFTRKMIQNQ